ncbi:hypothetical protein [Nitrosopumilus sp.]
MRDEILKLKGEEAAKFLKYDTRKLTAQEKKRNTDAYSYYLKNCKC